MASSGEIVVIQAGYFSNYVGAHWWNMQESSFCYNSESSSIIDINHDILFREGENLQGEVTYTPRLVLIDLKNNLKNIQRESPLLQCPLKDERALLWDGPLDVVKASPVRKNQFLESSARVENKDVDLTQSESSHNFDPYTTQWSDFLKTKLHPKSFCLFSEFSSSEDQNPLDVYNSGDEICKKSGRDFIEESLRQMTEECDHLQGFNLIFDAHNGFSAVHKHVSEHLSDEYNRNPSLCFPVFRDYEAMSEDAPKRMHRLFAVLSSLSNLNSFNSCFSPLSLCDDVVKEVGPYRRFPCLQYQENSLYHSSSIFAAAIEVLTSQYRLKSMKFSLSDVVSMMSMYGRKLTCSSICLPFPLSEDTYLDCMIKKDVAEYFPTSLSPFYNPATEKTLFQSAVLRGVQRGRFQSPTTPLPYLKEPEEIFAEYLNKYSASSAMTATVLSEKCNVSAPFPKLFNNLVGIDGALCSTLNNIGVVKVPIAASFNSSNSAAKFLEDILSQTSKITFRDYVKMYDSCVEKDEFEELHQNIFNLLENYQEC